MGSVTCQAEVSERLLDELANADATRAWHLERLLSEP